MSDFADMVKYIADNLTIKIDQVTVFGGIKDIEVELLIGENVISKDSVCIDNLINN